MFGFKDRNFLCRHDVNDDLKKVTQLMIDQSKAFDERLKFLINAANKMEKEKGDAIDVVWDKIHDILKKHKILPKNCRLNHDNITLDEHDHNYYWAERHSESGLNHFNNLFI